MLNYTLRRLMFSIPTLLVISFIIFLILDLAPGDPTGQLPMTVPPEVREQIRQSLGLGEPIHIRYLLWCQQFFINEPLNIIEQITGWQFGDGERLRVRSWATRSPVVDLIIERTPQTLWVVGMSYLIGVLIALPIGVISAYKQYSIFDQIGTFVSMIGFSVPTFFTGVLLIVIFSVNLGWFPSIYDTTHVVNDWGSFVFQMKQMIMPVFVLALYNAAQISRFMRASMLDNLNQDYVRTARAKGLHPARVAIKHVFRNALIAVAAAFGFTFAALVSEAVVTETVFSLPGIGRLVVQSILRRDYPVIQGVILVIVVLYMIINLLVDLAYARLDPRVSLK